MWRLYLDQRPQSSLLFARNVFSVAVQEAYAHMREFAERHSLTSPFAQISLFFLSSLSGISIIRLHKSYRMFHFTSVNLNTVNSLIHTRQQLKKWKRVFPSPYLSVHYCLCHCLWENSNLLANCGPVANRLKVLLNSWFKRDLLATRV